MQETLAQPQEKIPHSALVKENCNQNMNPMFWIDFKVTTIPYWKGLKVKRLTMPNVGKDVEQLEPSNPTDGSVI